MKVELNKIDDLNAELLIQIGSDDYNPRIEKTLKDYRKNAQIPGFRKGMVPMGQIQRMYGKSVKAHEINELVHESLTEYLKTGEIKILGDPLMNMEKTAKIDDWDNVDNLNFVFDLGIRPEVEVKLTKKNKIPYYKIDITKEQIDQTIKNITERYGSLEDVEEVSENDMLICSLKQLDSDGNILEGGISVESTYIRIENIEDSKTKKKFIGQKKDNKVIFNPKKAIKNTTEISALLKIEKEDAEALDCDFEVNIEQIRRLTPAEINTDLFNKVYPEQDITTEEQFRERILSEMEQTNKHIHESKYLNTAIKYLTEKINPKLPEEFLKRWLIDTEKMTQEKINEVWDDYRRTFQWQLIVEKIASDNNIKIDENDIIEKAKDEVRVAFSYYNMTNIPDETLTNLAKSKLEKENAYSRYASLAIESKVLEIIKEVANVEEIIVSAEKFNDK